MYKKLAVLVLAAAFLAGCFIVAPIPGGYVSVGIPTSVHIGADVTAHWSVIPNTTIYYSPALADILYYSGLYYHVVNGIWYVGSRYNGPWTVLQTVPGIFLRIPSTHPRYRIARWHPRYRRSAPPPPPKASPPTVPRKHRPVRPEEEKKSPPPPPRKHRPGRPEEEKKFPPPPPPPKYIPPTVPKKDKPSKKEKEEEEEEKSPPVRRKR